MNLRTALQERIDGKRKQNMEEAKQCYEQALRGLTGEKDSHGWAFL